MTITTAEAGIILETIDCYASREYDLGGVPDSSVMELAIRILENFEDLKNRESELQKCRKSFAASKAAEEKEVAMYPNHRKEAFGT